MDLGAGISKGVKRIGRMFILAMVMAGLLMPGLSDTASAQDTSLCMEADGQAVGAHVGGYIVAYGSGGSGSQIVLSDGSGYVSGGSGNDILCAWGGHNTLDGGSGNDVLIVMSGSGNDTLIGMVGDYFDGGSGRNEIIQQEEPEPQPGISAVWTVHGASYTPPISVVVTGTNLQPGADMDWISSGGGRTTIHNAVNGDGGFVLEFTIVSCVGTNVLILESIDRIGNTIRFEEQAPAC